MTDWTRERLNRQTKIKYVLPAYLILIVGSWLAYTRLDQLNDERLEDQNNLQLVDAYNQCVTRIETRTAIRQILITIITQFPASDGTRQTLALINEKYPELDLEANCGTRLAPHIADNPIPATSTTLPVTIPPTTIPG